LALARRFADAKPDRTLRFVAFTNEEPPYFQNEHEMGSWVYARRCRRQRENIVGVISLETMGYFSDDEGSQKYPPPLDRMYPSTGNFIGFVANPESTEFMQKCVTEFREHSAVPSEFGAFPAEIPGVGWSDHWSFWQEGYPGIMITDTAPYRYPHYHLPTDTPDRIDYDRLAKVVEGLVPVVEALGMPD
jgi:Zn-dependent M28 family amino/carboxypeptidase